MSPQPEFKDGDLVSVRRDSLAHQKDEPLIGRVVGEHHAGGLGPNGPRFYIVLLETKIKDYDWSALILPGVVLDRVSVLDDIARDAPPCCPWCRERP
ncbi:MAG: hypothetical protein AB7L09_00420 [Nitrospira sp.]